MPEPLSRSDAGEGPLAEAARRLEQALGRLERTLEQARAARPAEPTAPDARVCELQAANDALASELGAAKKRSRRLKAAAAEASEAIGRAAEEVRKTLDEDAAAQGLFAFALAADDGSGDEPSTSGPPEAETPPDAEPSAGPGTEEETTA